MRILILHMRYWPDATGTGPLVTELANDLAAAGNDVFVVTSAPHYGRADVPNEYRGKFFHYRYEEGVKVCRTLSYAASSGSVIGRSIDYVMYTLLSTVAAIAGGPQDVILCVTPPITVGLSGWWTSLVRRAPIIFNAQDIWPDGLIRMGRLRSRPLIIIFKALERFIYRVSEKVTVVSEGMKDNLIAKGVSSAKVEIIPNWVDLEIIRPMEKLNPFCVEQGLQNRFVILFAGNIGYASALETVIDAARILESDRRIVFLLVGEGSAKADLVKRSEALGLTNIRFLTTQPKERLSEVLGSADLSLVTLREGMGTLSVPSKAYAIMASTRAILAAVPADSEIKRIVDEVGCGLVVPPENAEALAEAIERLVESPDQLRDFGQRGRAFVVQHNERSTITTKYSQLLQGVAKTRAHPA